MKQNGQKQENEVLKIAEQQQIGKDAIMLKKRHKSLTEYKI